MLISGSVRHERTPSCSYVIQFGGIAKSSHRLAMHTIRAIILAGTPAAQETGEQFAYWSDLPIRAWQEMATWPRERVRDETLAGYRANSKCSRTNRLCESPPVNAGGPGDRIFVNRVRLPS